MGSYQEVPRRHFKKLLAISAHQYKVSNEWRLGYMVEKFEEDYQDVKTWIESHCHDVVYYNPLNDTLVFKHPEDILLFKLGFYDPKPNLKTPMSTRMGALNKVILPVIRRVMPQVMANQIIGVQPMTAPSPLVAALKTKYNPTPVPQQALTTPGASSLGNMWHKVKKDILDAGKNEQ